jgi:hypothetical protein
LSNLTQLQELSFDKTRVSDLSTLNSLPKLKRLSLKNTQVKAEGIARFRKEHHSDEKEASESFF